jgi:hypothetical protein
MNRDEVVCRFGAARRVVGFLALAASIIAVTPVAAQDADTQEVQHYTLTDAGLAKYTQATRKLAALPTGAANCDDDGSDAKSLDAMVAQLTATPGAQSAIQSAGMTPREYVVFSMSLLQSGMAAWALKQPGASLQGSVSKANVEFVDRHEDDLKKLEALRHDNNCDDRDE